jgi:hypothetical protein
LWAAVHNQTVGMLLLYLLCYLIKKFFVPNIYTESKNMWGTF